MLKIWEKHFNTYFFSCHIALAARVLINIHNQLEDSSMIEPHTKIQGTFCKAKSSLFLKRHNYK